MDPVLLNYEYSPHAGRPTVLYLHGFLGCKEDWSEVVAALGDDYGHLRVDLPGHGQSVRGIPESMYTMDGCAETLLALLDHLGISSCHVIGYSMGGRVALHLAVAHADRFERFVIESGSPGLRTAAEREDRIRHDRQVAAMIREREAMSFLDHWYSQPLFSTIDRSGERFNGLLQRRRHAFHREGLARSLECMGTGAQPSLWSRLSTTRNPLLFVAGERDSKFTALATDMAHLCPGGQVAIIPEAGHTIHFELPVEFCRQADAFLRVTE